MKSYLRAAALAATVLLPLGLIPLGAEAAVVVDQQYDGDPGNTAVGVTFTDLGQTFTIGTAGTFEGFQTTITTDSFSYPDLMVTLRSVTGGLPDTVLASTSITATTVRATPLNYIDFSFANIAVDIGDVLAVVFSTTSPGRYNVATDFTGVYAPGARVTSENGGTSFVANAGQDLNFTTFVEDGIAPVPLPAAAPLLGAGLLGLGLIGRRRKG